MTEVTVTEGGALWIVQLRLYQRGGAQIVDNIGQIFPNLPVRCFPRINMNVNLMLI